jgi:TonB family protein
MSTGLRRIESLLWFGSLPAVLICGTVGVLKAQSADALKAFYVVSTEYFDAQPFRIDHILDVRADGNDSVVRYSRIEPMDAMCLEAITVKTATRRLPGISPSQLVSKTNLCTIDTASLNRELRRRTHLPVAGLGFSFSGIVATCGTESVSVQLPDSKAVNLERLEKAAPRLARWWHMPGSIRERVFGTEDIFDKLSSSQNEQLQREGQSMVPEFLAGRFDAGLYSRCLKTKPCPPPSFAVLLRWYVGPIIEPAHAPRLLQEGQYGFSKYVAPSYPRIAVQALITGNVRVELEVDPHTGGVRNASTVSGNPVLVGSVVDTAKQWTFMPETLVGLNRPIVIEFAFERTCPTPLAR